MVMIKSFTLLSKPVTLTFASEVSDQVETSTNKSGHQKGLWLQEL